MNPAFPSLHEFGLLPRRVLCLAPHPDDEVLGVGGLLALHAARGDAVRVVVLTDGARGGSGADLAARRAAESRAACAELGVSDARFLGLADGELGSVYDLVARVRREIDEFSAELVYAPSPFEHHPDHRALCAATCSAVNGVPERTLMLYGVNAEAPEAALFDTTAVFQKKLAALRHFVSQNERRDLATRVEATDRARTRNLERTSAASAEACIVLASSAARTYHDRSALYRAGVREVQAQPSAGGLPRATAVLSTWNKKDDLRANLESLCAQTLPFESIVVVDNASRDGTAEMVAREFPAVRLVVMPHSAYGACETFNIGFASSTSTLTAILDDDIVMPPDWLEKATLRLQAEPATTAIVSTQVVEPGMPEEYKNSAQVNQERYMSTFRGCASLAWTDALRKAEYYDERLFIYGNERDLTCRLLNLGYRVLQFPGTGVFHKTPFGIKLGKRSLYYHARNAWLSMLKYAPLADLARMPFLVVTKVLLRGAAKEKEGSVSDAVGTIGIGRSLRETPGAWWVITKAAGSVLWNVPYCLKHRAPVRAADFELPLR